MWQSLQLDVTIFYGLRFAAELLLPQAPHDLSARSTKDKFIFSHNRGCFFLAAVQKSSLGGLVTESLTLFAFRVTKRPANFEILRNSAFQQSKGWVARSFVVRWCAGSADVLMLMIRWCYWIRIRISSLQLLIHWCCWCADAADALMLLIHWCCWCADTPMLLMPWSCWCCWCAIATEALLLLICWCFWCADVPVLLMLLMCWWADAADTVMLLIRIRISSRTFL